MKILGWVLTPMITPGAASRFQWARPREAGQLCSSIKLCSFNDAT